MEVVLLLALLTVVDGGGLVSQPGENVILPCKYDIKKHGSLSVCWNRGLITALGCKNQIISTKSGNSHRYQLLGRLDEGDVSLTILNVTGTDAGQYGCRVEIPGLFNDDKHYFNLTIEKAPGTTTSVPAGSTDRGTPTQQTAASQATGQMTAAASAPASPFAGVAAEQEGSSATAALVCVLFGLTVLATVGGVVVIVKKRRRLNKMPRQQQVNTSAWFSSALNMQQLQSRASAVENVYQIDGDSEGGEYQYCP